MNRIIKTIYCDRLSKHKYRRSLDLIEENGLYRVIVQYTDKIYASLDEIMELLKCEYY